MTQTIQYHTLTDTQFDKDKHPQCLKDVRVFTERYIKEIQMETKEKETLVRLVVDKLTASCTCISTMSYNVDGLCMVCYSTPFLHKVNMYCSEVHYCSKINCSNYCSTISHTLIVCVLIHCRVADAFKTEGNAFFTKDQMESAIICYTKALETCPLSCTERRVTYHRWVWWCTWDAIHSCPMELLMVLCLCQLSFQYSMYSC